MRRNFELIYGKVNLIALRTLAISIGAIKSGTKPILMENILAQMKILDKLQKIRDTKGKLSIIAIDIGIVNFAYCKLIWKRNEDIPVLAQWKKLELKGLSKMEFEPMIEKKVYNSEPDSMFLLSSVLLEHILRSESDVYLLERQRTRTMGSSAIPEYILRVNILEHLLYSGLRLNSSNDGNAYTVLSSSPKRMVDYWCNSLYESDLLRRKLGLKSKSRSIITKKFRIALVKSFIHNQLYPQNGLSIQKFKLNDSFYKQFENYMGSYDDLSFGQILNNNKETETSQPRVHKNDDFADSLLHGLAWIDWMQNYNCLKMLFRTQSENSDTKIYKLKKLLEKFKETRENNKDCPAVFKA